MDWKYTMTKKFLFFYFIACSLKFVFAQESNDPSLNLIDTETQSASDIDVGAGLQAVVTLPLQPLGKKLNFEILVFPEFKLDEAPLYEKNFKNEKSENKNIWRKTFKIPSFHNKEEIIERFGRVARIRISWKDEEGVQLGTLIRKYYLLESKDQKFFKILNPAELRTPNNADPDSVCSYRKNLEIVGPYLQNPSLSPQEYEFNQSVAFETLRYKGPLNKSALNTLGLVESIAPIFQTKETESLGWLMTGWSHFEGKDTKLSFKPKITLLGGQGGYFIKETFVKRFKAQLYSFDKRGMGSSRWLPQNEGLLDVGVQQFDFITLSFEDSQDPGRIERLLAERSQMMTSCSEYPAEADRVYHTRPTNTLHEEMFFF